MRMEILKFGEAMQEGGNRTNVVHIQFRKK